MENTVLVGLSRQIALRRELDVIANNLANLGTAGYKSESVLFEQHLASGAHTDSFTSPTDRNVAFVLDRETRTDMSSGVFEQTGSKFDVAIDGDGFLVVETPQGERYTRGGALAINTAGELVTQTGFRVLADSGPITLDPNDTEIAIARDGTVSTRDGDRGKLRLVRFENDDALTKEGNNLYASTLPPQPAEPRTSLVQGSIEKVTRAYTSLAALMNRTDELRRNAIQQLADVPA
jgi:flagellar basal-body rod protein FlgF